MGNLLNPLPESHEGEAKEESQDSSTLSHQGPQGEDQLLSLHQDGGRHVPEGDPGQPESLQQQYCQIL